MLSWICFCKFNVKDDFIIILVYICATKNLNHSIMASRKELKKQINDLTGQLALEILFRGTVMQVLEPEKICFAIKSYDHEQAVYFKGKCIKKDKKFKRSERFLSTIFYRLGKECGRNYSRVLIFLSAVMHADILKLTRN